MLPTPELKKINVTDYIAVVTRHIWIVIICLLIAIAVIVVQFGFTKLSIKKGPDIYEASATILLEEHPALQTLDIGLRGAKVERDIGVMMEQWMSFSFAEKIKSKLNKGDAWSLLSIIKVEQREGSIVDISARGTDPVEITDIVNTWVKEIVREDLESRMELSEYSSAWLEESRDEIGKKLQQAELELKAFQDANEGVEFKARAMHRLRSQREELENQLQEEMLKYKDQHPVILSLKRRIDIINSQMSEVYAGEGGEERELLESQVLEYSLLSEQAGTLNDLYDRFTQASEEADISKGLVLPSIQVLKEAQVPKDPIPQSVLSGGAGLQPFHILLFALVAGVGICFVLEYFDTTLKTPEEVEFYAKLPFLGHIPTVRGIGLGERQKNQFSHQSQDSLVAESFRNVKVGLIFASTEETELKSILVTSSLPGEGRTFVASNLAISFAAAEEKTLLIDSDLRKGRLGDSYYIDYKYGLSSVVKKECPLDQAILETPIPSLSILTSGPHFANATDLLSLPVTKEIMEKLKGKFQRIVVDGGPVIKYADDVLMAHFCDGIIHVISAGRTPLKAIEESVKKLTSESLTPIIGAVLNRSLPEKRLF